MKVTTEERGNHEIELTIEVDEDRVDRAMRSRARQYAREIRVPGFRPGRAPYVVIAQRVGRDQLFEDALEEIGPQIYQEALEEAGLQPFELNPLEVASRDPLTLKATIPLMPSAELGDYHSIRVDAPEVEISEADVEEVLREYQEENAQLVPVGRGAKLEDQVILDLKIEIDNIPMYDRKNISFVLSSMGLTGVPEGFAEQLVGMEAGEERQFTLPYPDDFEDADLAGKEGVFTVFMHEVKERELPALDDEFAQTVGEFETLDELRERTREVLLSRAQNEADHELAETVLTQVMDMATVHYPDIALERETAQVMLELEARLKDRGLTLDNYLVIESLTEDELRQRVREDAERRLMRSAVLAEVVRRENIDVSDREIAEEIEEIAALYGANAAQARASLSAEESRQAIRSRLLAQRALDRLVEIATNAALKTEREEAVTDSHGADATEDKMVGKLTDNDVG